MSIDEAIKVIAEVSCRGCKNLDRNNTCISTSKCFEAKARAIQALRFEKMVVGNETKNDV